MNLDKIKKSIYVCAIDKEKSKERKNNFKFKKIYNYHCHIQRLESLQLRLKHKNSVDRITKDGLTISSIYTSYQKCLVDLQDS